MSLVNDNDFIPFQLITPSEEFISMQSEDLWKLRFSHMNDFKGKELLKEVNLASGTKYDVIRLCGDMLIESCTEAQSEIGDTVRLVSQYVDLELGQDKSDVNKQDRVVYLAVLRKEATVIGYLEVEWVRNAHKLAIMENNLTAASKDSIPVKMGVSKIWVKTQYRGCGIGTRLMDVGRSFTFESITVDKTDVAFTNLSYDGFRFARKYLNGVNNINIYM